ncbi:MAG: Arm DNA-binding domain-containing protein, partial [Alphaproteobacteria bacterium]
MPKISKRVVDAAEPAASRYFIWDSELKGYGLLVLPSGVRSYVVQYRTPHGRTRRATIGKHGSPWTPDLARERADAMLRMVKDGLDPLDAKAAARNAMTVDDLLDRYLKSGRFKEKADSTRAIDNG